MECRRFRCLSRRRRSGFLHVPRTGPIERARGRIGMPYCRGHHACRIPPQKPMPPRSGSSASLGSYHDKAFNLMQSRPTKPQPGEAIFDAEASLPCSNIINQASRMAKGLEQIMAKEAKSKRRPIGGQGRDCPNLGPKPSAAPRVSHKECQGPLGRFCMAGSLEAGS